MPGGGYLTTRTITDSLGQVREVQQLTASGGSEVTDTSYNSDGWKALVSAPYYVTGAPSGTLVSAASSIIPSQAGYAYDGAGRVVRQIAYKLGTKTWETDASYGGNYTTVVPPSGGTAQTTFTDGRGLTTAIYQYHSGVPSDPADPAADYDKTSYTYAAAGKLTGITDAAGNTWSFTYDMLGNQLAQATPDSGTTTSSYDAAGQQMSFTDARSKTISWTYDADGRKTAEYDTTGGTVENAGDQLASWAYDTLAKGKLTSSTSYVNGAQYTEQISGYGAQGLPSGTSMVIPSAQGALSGTYTQQYAYAPDDQMTSRTDSAAGGLPSETITTGYDGAGQATSVTGAIAYVNSLSYTNLGQPLQYKMGTSSQPVYITNAWDPQTGRLTEQNTQTGTGQASIDDLQYSYDNYGNVTSEAHNPSGASGTADVQCFQNDYLGRLVQAWAQGTPGCALTPSASAEGGVAPYWNSYTYDVTGNLTGITSTTPAGAVTTTNGAYPAAGSPQPHAITSQKVTGPSATTASSYAYDKAGHLTGVTGSQNQSLTWNDSGQLSQNAVTPAGAATAQNTTYIYDADGNLLLTSDLGTTSLYLGDQELSLSTTTGTVTGTRYYSLGDVTIATRTGAGSIAYLAGDTQGTDSVAIDAATLNVTRRWYDPYGNPRGNAPATFPAGRKGFIGGVTDNATGLTNLGAREYQPSLGAFITTDPVLKPFDPQDLNPYAYAQGNPATYSDPSGLCTPGRDGCKGSWSDEQSGCTAASLQALQVCIANWKKQHQKPRGSLNHPICKAISSGEIACVEKGSGAVNLLNVGSSAYKAFINALASAVNCLEGGGDHLSCAVNVVNGLGLSFMTIYALITTSAGRGELAGALFLAAQGGPTDLLYALGGCIAGQSFTAATRVRLADGKYKAIGELKPGDKVLATDIKTGKTYAETVTAVIVHHDTDLYDLTIRIGARTAVIHTTSSHLFWDVDGHRWIAADALPRDARLVTPGRGTAIVEGGHVPHLSAGWMWDLTVLPSHDFYVLADTTPVLVHNAGGPPYNCTPLPTWTKNNNPLTSQQASQLAQYLGFRRVGGLSQNQQIFTNGSWYITQDRTGHSGGTWKIARSVKDLGRKDTRTATTDALLNIIGG
jgi:RHS repeat-associated protein